MPSALTSEIPSADPAWHRQDDHPFYKPSHYRLQRFVRHYVDKYIAPNVEEWEKAGEIPVEVRIAVERTSHGLGTHTVYRHSRDMLR